jgi:hypothetical protein
MVVAELALKPTTDFLLVGLVGVSGKVRQLGKDLFAKRTFQKTFLGFNFDLLI